MQKQQAITRIAPVTKRGRERRTGGLWTGRLVRLLGALEVREGMRRFTLVCTVAGLAGSLLVWASPVSARETDNFYLPMDSDLADLGEFLEIVHTLALEKVVENLNARIERTLLIRDESDRTKRLQKLSQPKTIAAEFVKVFGHPMFEDMQMERSIRGAWAAATYEANACSHRNIWMKFSAHVPLDIRRWTMLTQSRTVKAYGVYFGTDKLVHFHHLGEDYYRKYLSLLGSGVSKDEAYRRVVKHYAAQALFSEKTLFGTLATGVYSNADLAANHVGFKFYLNLTEVVALKGKDCEPLLARSGIFWRLNQHVRPRSGWFRAFISDHWNEALNPSLYDACLRPGIRRVLRNRAEHIVQFYTEVDKRPANAAYFGELAVELSTYYGEPYGHSGEFAKLMTIGNTCMPAIQKANPLPH